MDNINLGRWAVVDIETTGTDPLSDEIIDIGFLIFDGTRLEKKFQTLIRPENPPGPFIQKLTGISLEMLAKAPILSQVIPDIAELYGLTLLAHNAEFEQGFLTPLFTHLSGEQTSYADSLYFLALAFPQCSSLKLEQFIIEWNIREHEEHRGLSDAIDLLKVQIISAMLLRHSSEDLIPLLDHARKYFFSNEWCFQFLQLSNTQLIEIADQIDFEWKDCLEKALSWYRGQLIEEEKLSVRFPVEFNGEGIREVFRDEEKVREVFSTYHFRESQEKLAIRVGQAIKNKVHALIQAPTGTGKTLGYLVPSTFYALSEKAQVLVATGTKTLQEQAMVKDVPMLRKLLGLDKEKLKIAKLVGSQNHFCELMFRQELEEEDLFTSERSFDERFSDFYFERVFSHNARNRVLITRADVPYVLKKKIKDFEDKERSIAVDFRTCTGRRCPFKGECTFIQGLREAKEADIVVGNHALLFTWPRAFPRPGVVVIDEAHRIEGETTKAFSLEVSGRDLAHLERSLNHLQGIGALFYLLGQNSDDSTELINELRDEIRGHAQTLGDHLRGLEERIEIYFKKRPRYSDQYWNESEMVQAENRRQEEVHLYYTFMNLRQVLLCLVNLLSPYALRFDPQSLGDESQIIAYTRFHSFLSQIEDHLKAISMALGQETPLTPYAASLRFHQNEGFVLRSAPIDVGRMVHDHLLATSQSVIFTSATLGNAHGDQGVRGIEWAMGHSYLLPEKRFKQGLFLDPTFDYANKTKVYLCDDVPALYQDSFVPEVLGKIAKLIRAIGGRSLLLFSSKVRFDYAKEWLIDQFDAEIPVFLQGMGPRVVEDFKQAERGILVGMESFGEGIDVPGDGLQFVLIDKVPDLPMDLVTSRRREFYEANLGHEFVDYYLSHRIRSLHQKLGRLLRSERDFGGVIIVDSRIQKWKGRTMETVRNLLAPYRLEQGPLTEAVDQVISFLNTQNSESFTNQHPDC